MGISVEIYPVMPSRPCSFCLSLQGGGVFADFDIDAEGVVLLSRISFDGYGCCELGASVAKMSPCDSRFILDAIALGSVESIQIDKVLRSLFHDNMDVIWAEALEAHGLL